MGDRLGVAESLLALAGAVLPAGPADAARLLGASAALLSAVGAVPTPRQQDDLERVAHAAATAAGDDAAAARAEGAGLEEGQAVELALALTERLGAVRRATAGTT
jgi:hypothetical protein